MVYYCGIGQFLLYLVHPAISGRVVIKTLQHLLHQELPLEVRSHYFYQRKLMAVVNSPFLHGLLETSYFITGKRRLNCFIVWCPEMVHRLKIMVFGDEAEADSHLFQRVSEFHYTWEAFLLAFSLTLSVPLVLPQAEVREHGHAKDGGGTFSCR